MIRALILDCGGVLCYPRRGSWVLPNDLESILASPVPAFDPNEVRRAQAACAELIYEGRLVTSEGAELRLRAEYARRMAALLRYPLTDAQAEAIADSLVTDITRHAFYSDSLPAVRALSARVPVGLLSDSMPSLMRAVTESGLSKLLSSVVISCFHGAKKPDERLYLQSLRELNVRAEEAVFVDDLEANLLAAERLGMRAVRMIRPFYQSGAPAPFQRWKGLEVTDMAGLAEFISRHENDEAPPASRRHEEKTVIGGSL